MGEGIKDELKVQTSVTVPLSLTIEQLYALEEELHKLVDNYLKEQAWYGCHVTTTMTF
jgi:hypothetical protein